MMPKSVHATRLDRARIEADGRGFRVKTIRNWQYGPYALVHSDSGVIAAWGMTLEQLEAFLSDEDAA